MALGRGGLLVSAVFGLSPGAALAVLFAGFGKFALVALMIGLVRAFPRLRARRVVRLPYEPAQFRAELRAAWVVPLDGVALFAALRGGAFPLAAPTWAASAATCAVLTVFFELWFYATHRLLHTPRLYAWHALHHEALVTGPASGLRFALPEKVLLTLGSVGAAVAAAHVMPVTLPGFIAFLGIYYCASILGHANVEPFPARLVRSRLGWCVATPTFHALHHARLHGHYGLMTPVLDTLCGTRFVDYAEVQARAVEGRGLERLGQRAG